MRRFGYWLAGSALILPIWTAGAQETAQGPAPEAFHNPPADSRPGTFYHWMNGNVTAAGLDADLTSMRDIGLGGVMAFDGSNDVPKGPVDYLSPTWLGLISYGIFLWQFGDLCHHLFFNFI